GARWPAMAAKWHSRPYGRLARSGFGCCHAADGAGLSNRAWVILETDDETKAPAAGTAAGRLCSSAQWRTRLWKGCRQWVVGSILSFSISSLMASLRRLRLAISRSSTEG